MSTAATAVTHTPGPWLDGGPLGFARLITNCEGALIACIYGPNVTSASAANVHLIAASPDMLAALKLVISYHDSSYEDDVQVMLTYLDAIEAAKAAIAKAEGR